MKRLTALIISIVLAGSLFGNSIPPDSTEVFLLTCLPGNTIITVYGHSAIRIVKKSIGFDEVYNWGIYDFSTPHFIWKFAQGRLKYELEKVSYDSFLQDYLIEKRTVLSQRVNLNKSEAETLLNLININMLPENRLYLYDFYFDNCATRIRNILEKSMHGRIVYPTDKNAKLPTFRKILNQAEGTMPWLSFGTDLLIGPAGDKHAGFREQMYLPEYLQRNLSRAIITRSGKSVPLLGKDEIILNFTVLTSAPTLAFTPFAFFSVLFLLCFFLPTIFRSRKLINTIDGILVLSLLLLSALLVFTDYFTDHMVMRMNYNLIWLNPFLFFAFIALLRKKGERFWFMIIFVSSAAFLIFIPLMPQSIHIAMLPLITILAVRSGLRAWIYARY